MMGLPSLHALDQVQASRIWLATEKTDMRCGFDRLAERVRTVIGNHHEEHSKNQERIPDRGLVNNLAMSLLAAIPSRNPTSEPIRSIRTMRMSTTRMISDLLLQDVRNRVIAQKFWDFGAHH